MNQHRYILWTSPLGPRLSALAPASMHSETCEGVGEVPVYVYADLPNRSTSGAAGTMERLLDHFHKTCQWLPLNLRRQPGKAEAFSEPNPS